MSTAVAYEVKVNKFEGPLDLLLHLVTKNEMDLNDIPMAQITSQYLHYLDQMEAQNLDVASEFLVMAATLIHIKSKLLLPRHSNEEVTDEDELDPRLELVQRLLEYRRYKEGAEELSTYPQLDHDVFSRPLPPANQGDDLNDASDRGGGYGDVGLFELVVALRDLLKEPVAPLYHDVTITGITVDEAIIRLRERLKGCQQLLFTECFVHLPRREEVVVMFIAVLELVKCHHCRVVQLNPRGSLYLYPLH